MFDICKRIQEVDKRLFIITLPEDEQYNFAIMEQVNPSEAHLVKKYAELDARVISDVQYMQSIPLNERVKVMEREIDAANDKFEDDKMEELYENMGRAMWTQLDHDGFIAGGRAVSYAKRGVTGGKGSRFKSS